MLEVPSDGCTISRIDVEQLGADAKGAGPFQAAFVPFSIQYTLLQMA